jgi:ubiquinone/menaquinone biosynthesis C-methylase UbiE
VPSADEQREQQKKTWNKYSGGWKKWDAIVVPWLAPTGEKMIELAGLKDGDRVMDMSTGTGEPGVSAAKKVGSGSVVGVDLAEDMLAVAAARAAELGLKNFSTQAFDGLKTPFADNSFDAILCRYGVMFSPEPVALMKEMLRTLKPGRRMSVATWAPKEENPWITTGSAAVAEHLELPQPAPDAPQIFRHADPELLKRELEAAGLKQVEVVPVTGFLTVDSAATYWQLISEVVAPVSAALAKADEATRQKVGASAEQRAAKFARPDGSVALPWKSWVGSGVK